jgi:glucose-6-phosphate 1-dehydrogenase
MPTFAAIKLEIDNWRWQGVPFYLMSGKRLDKREIEITVQFKRVPTSIFKPLSADQLTSNQLTFRIQPDEGIVMRFEAKKPGPKLCIATVHMDFGFEEAFKVPQPESYARLFLDAMKGDQTLFARGDNVLESWRIMDPITQYWESKEAPAPIPYPAGSEGPPACDKLLAKDQFSWVS